MKSRYLNWLAKILSIRSNNESKEENECTSEQQLPCNRLFCIVLIVILAMSFIPLLVEMPYVCFTMKSSPLESMNYVFLLLAIAQAAFSLMVGVKNDTLIFNSKLNVASIFFILISIACLVVSWQKNIHLISEFASVCLFWSVASSILNWPTACSILPACAMFMLGVPSTGFLLGNACEINGLTVKFILAAFLLLLTPFMTGKFCPSPNALLYILACFFILACYGVKMSAERLAPSMVPMFNALAADVFKGTNMDISEQDKTFFGNSDIQRFMFTDNDAHDIHVLDVANVANIHAIHPMAYCLRASGFAIESDQTISITVGGSNVFVQEISANRDDIHSLHWQWYTTSEYSTASFMLFRSVYSPEKDWRMMQIYTDFDGTAEEARRLFLRFTDAFLSVRK